MVVVIREERGYPGGSRYRVVVVRELRHREKKTEPISSGSEMAGQVGSLLIVNINPSHEVVVLIDGLWYGEKLDMFSPRERFPSILGKFVLFIIRSQGQEKDHGQGESKF
jgi:hypothetical protein